MTGTKEITGEVWRISILSDRYSPETIIIKPHDTVIWINDDDMNRTITSWHTEQDTDGWVVTDIGKIWNSGDIRPGGTFSRTFDEAGEYDYLSFPLYLFNSFQLQPIGKVIVRE